MKRAVIFRGGDIDTDLALSLLEKDKFDYLIGADRGIRFLREQGLVPTHIVGDFDSASAADLEFFRGNEEIKIHTFRPEKDFTDTQIGVELALTLKSDEIYILGGMGNRVDHLLANIRVLSISIKQGAVCYLMDPFNKIWITDAPVRFRKKEMFGKYVSLFALGEPVTGLTLTGFKYPLTDYWMTGQDCVGVSNEIIAETAEINFTTGLLVVAESTDKRKF